MNNQVKEIIFSGPDGKLVGKYKKGQSLNPPIALLLHPHPLYGGTMNNPIVIELYNILTHLAFQHFVLISGVSEKVRESLTMVLES